MEKVCYEELRPREFARRLARAPIAYLPLGTLEWHGLHLPLGADGLQSGGFFQLLAQRVGGIVLPMLFVGPDLTRVEDGQTFIGMDFWSRPEGQQPRQLPGSAYYVSDELFAALLEAILAQLARAGFKIVVAHGHGPSTRAFLKHAPQWEQSFGLKLLSCWSSEDRLGIQTDHAAANETSLTMALYPDLVDLDELDPDPGRFPEGVHGDDPRVHASAQLGRRAMEEASERMVPLLTELCSQFK
jgi:creatinine amidohydrolase